MKTELEIKAQIKENKLILKQQNGDLNGENGEIAKKIARDFTIVLRAENRTLEWVLTDKKEI